MRETIWLENMVTFEEGVTVRQYVVVDAIGETTFPLLRTGGFTGRGDSGAIILWMIVEHQRGEAPMEVSEGAKATEPNLK